LVEHYGEPYADSSAVPTYYVAKETRKHVTVALNGDGGDESFAGYERYIALGLTEKYRKVPSFLRESVIKEAVNQIPASPTGRSRIKSAQRMLSVVSLPKVDRYTRWVSVFNEETKRPLYSDFFREQTNGANATGLLEEWFKRANGIGVLDAMLLTDQMTYLPNDLLVKVDIATMAVSLEARSPFLDHKVIEFAASLPEGMKMRRFETKSLLKKVAARLVPREVIYRRKMGFGVPVGRWFRGEMKDFVRDVLLSPKALSRGIVKPAMMEKYVNEHTEGKRDHSFQLWTLLMLELWFQKFID
jgi:asparagine synthase (glutamine-hydrolysing)